jgi:hypothetical protein
MLFLTLKEECNIQIRNTVLRNIFSCKRTEVNEVCGISYYTARNVVI